MPRENLDIELLKIEIENHKHCYRLLEEERHRLYAALESISKNSCCSNCKEASLVAKKALASGQINETTRELEKPPFMVKKETFLSDSGSELILGYIVVDINNQQVSPQQNKVFLTFPYAEEAYKKLFEFYWERKELEKRLWVQK